MKKGECGGMLLREECNKGGTELTGFGEVISHPDRSDFNGEVGTG